MTLLSLDPPSPPTSDSTQLSAVSRSFPLRYSDLKRAGLHIYDAAGRSSQQLANLASALHLWMRTHKVEADTVVGEQFATQFDDLFLVFQDLQRERLSARTLKDRCEQVLLWRRIAQTVCVSDALPESFSDAVKQAIEASGLSRAAVARRAGFPPTAIANWLHSKALPHVSSYDLVLRLEQALGLPKEALLRRLPPARLTRYARVKRRSEPTAYSERLRKNRVQRNTYAAKPTPRLRRQWRELVEYKTTGDFPQATKHNTWRIKPPHRVGCNITWAMVCSQGICVTSSVDWGFVSSFLGFLALPEPEGPGIVSAETDTLAWLVHRRHVKRYARWLKQRAGGINHHGPVTFLTKVMSYLRPESGFIWSQPALVSTLPQDVLCELDIEPDARCSLVAAWRAACEQARADIKTELRRIHKDPVRHSRDPRSRISGILAESFPLKRLERLVQDLERDAPPAAHHRDYLVWIRDVLLLRLILNNPLRISQISAMTYRQDGSGNLYRVPGSGAWRLRFQSSDFKNEKGAAAQDYDASIDASVWPWIHRYLSESRPYLVGAADSSYLFLPAVAGWRTQAPISGVEHSGCWTSGHIAQRIKTITARYVPECDGGFGPHAWRHILATDHLRRHPNDFMTVALLLHDKLATVLKNYGHVCATDGLRVLHDGLAQARRELAEERERRQPGTTEFLPRSVASDGSARRIVDSESKGRAAPEEPPRAPGA